MTLLFGFDTNEFEIFWLDGNELFSTDSNFNANRTRFCGRRLCNTAADNISDESDENDDFDGELLCIELRFGNEFAPIITIKLIIKKKQKKLLFHTYEVMYSL
jgi:hypothetical protein